MAIRPLTRQLDDPKTHRGALVPTKPVVKPVKIRPSATVTGCSHLLVADFRRPDRPNHIHQAWNCGKPQSNGRVRRAHFIKLFCFGFAVWCYSVLWLYSGRSIDSASVSASGRSRRLAQ